MAHMYPYGDHGSRTTLRSGKTMYVEKHDRAPSRSDSPDIPLVFIHGFVSTIKTWVPLLPLLPEYTRIVYDVDPYGRTGPSGMPLTMKDHARDVDDILHHFGYDSGPVVLIGHSAGSPIAEQFAHNFPDRVRKLILLGPAPVPVSPVTKEAARTGFFLHISVDDWIKLHSSWLCQRCKDDPDILALIRDDVMTHEKIRESVDMYYKEVADFEFPGTDGVEAWVIRGLQDTAFVFVENSDEAVRKATNATMIEMDTGHYFTWEDLDGTLKAITTALTSGVPLK